MKTRSDAQKLLEEWVKSESLRRHCLGVAVCMEAYAKKYISEGRIKDKSSLELTGNDGKQVEGPSYQSEEDLAGVDNSLKGDGNNEVSKVSDSSWNVNEEDGVSRVDNNSDNNPDVTDNNSVQDSTSIVDKYWICGLLHDFDWERFPSLEEHPIRGCEELRKLKCDEDIITAILGHNKATGIKRYSLMAKTLFAVDELSGLVIALAHVRPGAFEGMNAKSVRKAMKKKDFAKAINREDIQLGMEELGFGEDDSEARNSHFQLVIDALESVKGELGFSDNYLKI